MSTGNWQQYSNETNKALLFLQMKVPAFKTKKSLQMLKMRMLIDSKFGRSKMSRKHIKENVETEFPHEIYL